MSAEEFKKEVEQDVHKRNKIVESLIAFGVLLVAAGLIGYGIWAYLGSSETVDSGSLLTYKKPVTETSSTATATTTVSDPLKYVNNQFGFNLTFPNTWKNYGVSENLPDDGYEVKTIYFGVPAAATSEALQGFDRNYTNIFAISIYTKAQWTAAQKEPLRPTYLKEKGDYVFTYSLGNGVPNPKGITADQVRKDAQTIIDSFKFN